MERIGHPEPKLIIWIESEKSSPRGEALIHWHLKRLSLQTQEIAVDYDCNAPKTLPFDITHIVSGKNICKPMTGAPFVKYKYVKLLGRPIWISHSFEYGLVDAAENYCINRLLFVAASSAGLSPLVDLTVPMYQHFTTR